MVNQNWIKGIVLVFFILITIESKSISLISWASNPVTIGENVVDDYSNAGSTFTATLTSNATVLDLDFSQWVDKTLVLESSGTDTLFVQNLTSYGGHSIVVQSGVTLIVSGTANISQADITVNSGGSIVFENDVTFASDNSYVLVEDGASIDIGGTLNITAGPHDFDIYGDLTTNNLAASGSATLDIFSTGTVKVINDASFTGTTPFDISADGQFLIGGDLTVDNGTTYTIDGDLIVGGTIKGSAAATVAASPNTQQGVGQSQALPIELVYFKTQITTNSINLLWQTASEENNDYFTLERSVDGVNFKIITIVEGAGNSYSDINYSTIDNHPITGTVYYRLKQTDFDGKFSYSDIVSVYWDNNYKYSSKSIKVFPNPYSNGPLQLSLGDLKSGTRIKVSMYNTIGRQIVSKDYVSLNNNNLDISQILENHSFTGLYYIVIEYNGKQTTKSLIVE